jgi:predicted TIM-barrel fold metal-dependent hydrolase
VIVQPSFYSAVNSATLDALDALDGQGRGVAVVDPRTVQPETLAEFHRRGVRGLRVNLYSPIKAPGGDTLEAAFAATAEAARMMGWHVQVIAPLPVLLANADTLAKAPVPVVIDHYGLYGDRRPDSVEGRRLLDLVALPHVWMKLSAPYRHDRGPVNTRPDREWRHSLRLLPTVVSGGATGRIRQRTSSRRVRHSKRRIARCPMKRWSTIFSQPCRPLI